MFDLVFFILALNPAKGQLDQSILRKSVDSFDVDSINRIDAVLTLARLQKFPLGIEYTGPKLFELISVHVRNTDTQLVMEDIFPAADGFRILIDDGVPVVSDRELGKSSSGLMNTVLSEFSIPTKCSVQKADALLRTQLYRQLTQHAHQGYGGSISGGGSPLVGPFDLAQVTIRHALDRIVLDRGQAAWIAQASPDALERPIDSETARQIMSGQLIVWTLAEYDSVLIDKIGRITQEHVSR